MNQDIYNRITKITGTNGKEVWKLLTSLQSEQAPWLNEAQVQDCVIDSLAHTYQDYELCELFFCQNSPDNIKTTAA